MPKGSKTLRKIATLPYHGMGASHATTAAATAIQVRIRESIFLPWLSGAAIRMTKHQVSLAKSELRPAIQNRPLPNCRAESNRPLKRSALHRSLRPLCPGVCPVADRKPNYTQLRVKTGQR
jgi:hypothetical protein